MAELTKGDVLPWIMETVGWFEVRQLKEDLSIGTDQGKANLRQILSRLVKGEGELPTLEKHPTKEGFYRYIRREGRRLNPKADPSNSISLQWPRCIETDEHFNLDSIRVYPKSVIVVAGVSNKGKTAFLLNFLTENMEKYHCVYMTNELGDEEFVDRIGAMDWVEARNGHGDWKFDALEHFENYHDIIQDHPDDINIIDYLDPGENPYFIGILIDQIRQRLGKGAAVVAIQKGVNKWQDKEGKTHYSYREYGTGGQYSEHRARLVLHIDPYGDVFAPYLLTIKKSKTAGMTGRRFKFNLLDGCKFINIEEITE